MLAFDILNYEKKPQSMVRFQENSKVPVKFWGWVPEKPPVKREVPKNPQACWEVPKIPSLGNGPQENPSLWRGP